MRAGPGGARLIILIKEQQGARDCNMSYALSQIAKSSDRTQNNTNSLVSAIREIKSGKCFNQREKRKSWEGNDWKEKMILILMMRRRQKMNAPISRFNKRLSRGRGELSGYIFVKRGKGPILQKVISLLIIHSHKSIFFKFSYYFRAFSMLSSHVPNVLNQAMKFVCCQYWSFAKHGQRKRWKEWEI